MTDGIPYERIGKTGVGWKFARPRLPDGAKELVIYAEEIQRKSGEARAYVKIGPSQRRPVAAGTVELKDDGRRDRLANKASAALWGVKYNDPLATDLSERLMLFCEGLYDFWIGQEAGRYVEGDAERSAPRWAVPGLVLDGQTSIWAGDREAGKSTLMRITAQSINHGIDHIVPVLEPAPVAWVNAEESPEEHTRQLGNINAALGLPRTAPLYTIEALGMTIHELAPRLEKAVEREGIKHIFIDSISRLSQGMSLNNNETATLLVDSVAGFGTSVNWIGHTGHENAHRLSGSRHFENAARLMVLVQGRISQERTDPQLTRGVRARFYKANGAPKTDPQYWTITYHPHYGLETVRGSSPRDWPVLRCDFEIETRNGPRTCNRKTWDGVQRDGGVLCSRHRNEEEEE